MDFKVIAKYSLLLYLSLMLSGIPIGYFFEDIDQSGEKFPSWVVFYKYAVIFSISILCFYFLEKSSKSMPATHGVFVIFFVSAFSFIVDFTMSIKFNFLLWFTDVGIVFLSLIVLHGASTLRRPCQKHPE